LTKEVYVRESDKSVMIEVAPHQSVSSSFIGGRGSQMAPPAPAPAKTASAIRADAK
jgi:hypothetical protein